MTLHAWVEITMCKSLYPGPLPGGSGASMSVQFYKPAVVIVHICELMVVMVVDTERYVETRSLNGSTQKYFYDRASRLLA